MDCQTCQQHFTELLEGGDASAPEAAQHLAECAVCAAARAAFQQTVRHLRSLPVVPPPPRLRASIARALDAAPARPAPGPALWQPLTAGLSMAACLCLLLWAVVLHPVPVGPTVAGPEITYQAPTTMPTALPTAVPAEATGRSAEAGSPSPPVSRRAAGVPVRMVRPPSRPGGGNASQPPSFGSWGERMAQLPPASGGVASSGAGSDKPVGTFAAFDATPPTVPLQRQAGPVELAFAPPPAKAVGEPVVGELSVSGQAEAMVTLRVTAERGLRVTHAPGGVVYEGPLRRGETLKVPLRMLAWRAGEHRLRAQLASDVPGVAADLQIAIPGFVGEMGKNGQAEVSLRFHETPAHQAIRQLAAAAGVRVVVHGALEPKLVTLDFSAGVPFAAALRILCDDCGYRIEERDGVYHIVR